MKLKRDVIEALASPGVASTVNSEERSDMLLRDLEELSELPLGPRERFLVTRIETGVVSAEGGEGKTMNLTGDNRGNRG
jgi:hypothetical protein